MEKGKQYIYVLTYSYDTFTHQKDIHATYGGLTNEDVIKNSINEQTEILKNYYEKQEQLIQEQTGVAEEQLETSKGIWETLKSVLNFINPLSENFFVYKLIDLLVDALKSLFVPSSEFFNNWVSDINLYFGDRFGLLYYPIEIVIEFLTRLYNICNSLDNEFILTFSDLKIMDTTLIKGFSFDFGVFLENDTFKNIYDIYLICVDVILILGLVVLCKNTFADVFGGKFVDDVVHAAQAEELSYAKYERHQRNRERYKNGGE